MPTPEFILALRKKVGHDLLHVPTVAVVARNDAGEVLLVKDSETGVWGCPGGILEPNESPADGAVRETWEEAGVLIELSAVLGVFGGEHCAGVYKNGDKLAWTAIVFSARAAAGSPRPDGSETLGAQFFAGDQLEQLAIKDHSRMFLAAEVHAGKGAYFAPRTWRPPV